MTASRRTVTIYLPLSLAAIVLLFPFYWMLITSLKTDRELIDLSGLPFWVFEPTLEHYQYLFAETGFLRWALNTLTISVVATAISLACSILAGYALARLRFRGAGAMAGAIFITYLVPQTLLFVPLLEIVRQLGLSNTLWSMILTYPTILIPFSTWLLMGYFRSIPRELEESALIDGASRLRAMAQIVLPLAMPGILSAGIFAFTLSWNEFIYALVFTNSTDIKTIPVGVVTELVKGDVYFWGSLMAGALLGSVPVALIYSFFVDRYVSGLTAGAVKG
ncbi:MAG: carbohydrate ABC transporter permease [Chloroflexi bacterium]|jgi:multiple sugar transport system permease protein|nr:MAG: carbohydrate ABC transporter permease [Chloroflexota bacterium]